MKSIFAIILCLFTLGVMAQTDSVELETREDGNILELWISNNSEYPMEVSLYLFNLQNLRGRKNSTASIPANDKVLMRKLRIKGDYDFNYELKKTYSEDALVSKQRNVENVDLNESIVVFNKKRCSRCQFLVNYLMDHEIDFQLMDLNDKRNKEYMYKLLENSGVYKKRVMTPIVVVDEKISYSHENLKKFAQGLK